MTLLGMTIWLVLLSVTAILCFCLWVDFKKPKDEYLRNYYSKPPKRDPNGPCPVTGLMSCPWHPEGGNHPNEST